MTMTTPAALPAFPTPGDPMTGPLPGMTLRQWYAGLAMQGLVSKGSSSCFDYSDCAGRVATHALYLADALLAALENPHDR